MNINKIKKELIDHLKTKMVFINGDEKNLQITAIHKKFNGINQVKRQQIIYKPISKYILENKIHSVSIKTYTPTEWNNINLLHKKNKK
ncbi:MAG: BolA/IbaG family iron-sulfur metabolism protein [Arsenophonus sp.]|nr:MAG: BolA/IbaG family iron-sulfur metabolism protein [Arsenophonus sp.]